MNHLPLAATAAAAAAVMMLGLPPARATAGPAGPAGPAGSCATITRAAGHHYHAALALGRDAAAARATRDDALAARDDRLSQQHMSRFYAAVGRGLARNCYLGHPDTGPARR
jgi:hypothetical protein